jgi:hypothetical protein
MLVRGLSKTRQVEMDRMLVVEAMNEKKNDNERQVSPVETSVQGPSKSTEGLIRTPRSSRA